MLLRFSYAATKSCLSSHFFLNILVMNPSVYGELGASKVGLFQVQL